MDSTCYDLCGKLIDSKYVRQGEEGKRRRNAKIKSLLQHKKVPDEGWDDMMIELFIKELSLMDTNNFVDKCGAGEREGRVYSGIVAKRHFGFSHGIGRSGDVTAIQPKAAGSSVMVQLTNAMALDMLQTSGVVHCKACFVVPVATGMSIVLVLLTLKSLRPAATHVVWSRIDQKSCFKAVAAAGLTAIVVDPLLVGDQLETDLEGIEEAIGQAPDGAASILCVLTTTSCFAPRAPDNLIEVGKICKSNVEQKVSKSIETELGSMLFTRCVSGARAVSSSSGLLLNGHHFVGWGAHHPTYPRPYLTAGVGIGMTRDEIDVFVERLDKVFKRWQR